MAFKATSQKTGQTFHLHKVKGNGGSDLFHFRKTVNPATAVPQLPPGMAVGENPVSGMPFVRRGGAAPAPIVVPPPPNAPVMPGGPVPMRKGKM